MTTDASSREYAVRLVLAMMASASTDTIKAADWWDRATSALVTGATRSTIDEMVSTMARKLQIESLRPESASLVSSMIEETGFAFEPLRRYCERNAPMAVALARVRRQAQREEAAAIKDHARPIEAQLAAERERRQAAEMKAEQFASRLASAEADINALKRALEAKG